MNEDDLRMLIINGEARSWYAKNIANRYGWLHDWDDEKWALSQYQFFLKFLQVFDIETRRAYFEFMRNPEKRQEYGAENVADGDLDNAFFKRWWRRMSYERGSKYFASKAAAVYFAFNDDLRRWYQDVWLASEYSYCSERDDVFLATILADINLRVKTPEVVQMSFKSWVMPLVGTLDFCKAKRFGYNVEEFAGDVYQRICGREGRRKFFANGVDYWLKERPTATLGDWFTLEATRVIYRFTKRQQRKGECLLGDNEKCVGANTANFDKNEMTFVDLQTLFDDFFKEAPAEAALLASYFSGATSYNMLASFWNYGQDKKVAGASLGQHCRRIFKAWRSVVEKKLALGTIPKEAWKEVFSELRKDAREDDQKTTKKKKEQNLRGGPKSKNWRKNIRFVTEPTKDDARLCECWLENQRIEESGSFARLYEEKTQRIGITPLIQGSGLQKETPCVVPRQNSLISSGSPNLIPVAEIVRRYWRNKYAANYSATFYYESATEKPGSLAYWRAMARAPLFAEPDAEIAFVISGYDKLYSWPSEVRLGEIKAPVVHGVALFRLDEFRAEIEGNTPVVTMVLRSVENRRETRWHVKRESAGKLLLQKPVLPDDE